MSDPIALLRAADPAGRVAVPPPRMSAADLIAAAGPDRQRPRRRTLLLVTAAAAAVVAAATAAVVVLRPVAPAPVGPAGPAPLFGPLIRPAAVEYENNPPSAAEQLRALAAKVGPEPCDTATGRYTYLHTIGWNAVFDDDSSGNKQVIRPEEKERWFAADGSGRIKVTPLAPVYPNEASRKYWSRKPPLPAGPRVDDLPAGMAGPTVSLGGSRTEVDGHLDTEHGPAALLRSVAELYGYYAFPAVARAEVLQILAERDGVVWRGSTTDRLGRAGVAVSADGPGAQELLIFDPATGALLAWDEVERPKDTVAGAKLVLGCNRTDQPG